MAAFEILVFLLAVIGSSDAAWCVCKPDQPNPAQQKTLDYACGAGADCNPIIQNGVCFNPNTVIAHCSYAANSYYQRRGQAQGACDFAGTAMLVSSDPSPGGGCTYPANPSAAGTSNTPTNTNSIPGSSTTPNTFTPNSGGTGTGVIGGLGPSGNSMSTDGSDGGFLPMAKMSFLFLTITLTCHVLLRL